MQITRFIQPYFLFTRVCACIALSMLLSAHHSLADEITPQNQTQIPINATESKPALSIALEKLQNFGSQASSLTMTALEMLGIHYKYGGNNPNSGLDCSGLVRYVFKETLGTILPRSAIEISRVGEKISPKDLQPGDLVFYNTLKHSFSHVGIYLGDNKFIHSPSAGGSVRVEDMDLSYWKKRFNGARRITEPEQK